MNRKLAAFAVAIGSLIGVAASATPIAHADGEVVTVTESVTEVHVGQPITFTVTSNTDLVPTGKITYRNPRTFSTINVANNSAFTIVGNTFTYVPSLGEVNRIEVFTGTIGVVTPGHLVRLVAGSIAFKVVP